MQFIILQSMTTVYMYANNIFFNDGIIIFCGLHNDRIANEELMILNKYPLH